MTGKFVSPLLLFLTFSIWTPAATLYVSATSGNDSNNCQSAGAPCKTIQRASSLTLPGDVVQIAAGTYPERVYVTRSGSAVAPITYRGHNGQGCPSVTSSDPFSRGRRPSPTVTNWGFYVRADYLVLECMKVIGLPAGTTVNPGDLSSGFYIHTSKHHVTINDNVVDASATPGNPTAGVRFGPLANPLPYNVNGARNYVRNTGYGLLVYCATSCLFEDNEIENLMTTSAGVDLDYVRLFGTNLTFRRNYFHGNSALNCQSCHIDCFQTWNLNQYANEIAQNVNIDSNVCFNAHQGIILRDQTSITPGVYPTHFNWTVTNNVFAYGPTGSSAAWCALFEHAGNITFRHNLCYAAGQVGYLDGTSATHEFNIHHGSGTPYNAGPIGATWAPAASLTSRRNIIFSGSPGRAYTPAAYPNDIINADPAMVSASTADFRLTSKSPAVNNAAGSLVPLDRLGVARPKGGAPDIGPYEWQGTLGFLTPSTSRSLPMRPDREEDFEPQVLGWDLAAGDRRIAEGMERVLDKACRISAATVEATEATSLRIAVERRASTNNEDSWEAISGPLGLADAHAFGDTSLTDWADTLLPAGTVLRVRTLEEPGTSNGTPKVPVQLFLRCD